MVILTHTERGVLSSKNSNVLYSSGVNQNSTGFNKSHGTCAGSTTNTITLESGADSAFNNCVIEIIKGRGINQSRFITGFTSLVATISSDWDIPPDTTSLYVIHLHSGFCQVQDQPNTNYTIKLSSLASSIDNFYKNCFIKILNGSGRGILTEIVDYDGTTKIASVKPLIDGYLSSSSLYAIFGESGSSPNTGGANDATHIVLDGNQSPEIGEFHYIEINEGTGNGQIRMISSITSDIALVSSAWDTVPDDTSKYNIFGGWGPASYETVVKHALITVATDIGIYNGESCIIDLESAMDIYGVHKNHQTFEMSDIFPANVHALTVTTNYFRLKIISMGSDINGGVQTILNSYKSGKLTAQLEQNIGGNSDCELSRSVITGKTHTGNYRNILSDTFGNLRVNIKSPLDSFGNITTTSPSQEIQLMFEYNIINTLSTTTITANNGTVSAVNSMAKVSTGTNVAGMASLYSKQRLKYVAGMSFKIKFSAIFSTPVADSVQIIGLGDSNNGLFIGYNGLDFGILRKSGGKSETRRLTITTGSTVNETITITLDGEESAGIAILSTDNVQQIARKIVAAAATHFYDLGEGWDLYEEGADVVFIARHCGSMAGTYSLNNGVGDSAGTFSQVISGVDCDEDWCYQNEWNVDRCDNLRDISVMNWQKGNVFGIDFQWHGFGSIVFKVQDPDSGHYDILHIIEYANEHTIPSLANPNLPLAIKVEKTGGSNADDLTIYSAAMGIFIMGVPNRYLGTRMGLVAQYSTTGGENISAGTYYNLTTIRNNITFGAYRNTTEIMFLTLSMGFNAGTDIVRSALFTFFVNATLSNSTVLTWTKKSASLSPVEYCNNFTTISGGIELISVPATKGTNIMEIVKELNMVITPGLQITCAVKFLETIEGTAPTDFVDATISASWIAR